MRADNLLTIREAAEASGYCYDHFVELCRAGKIPVEQRCGRRLYFRLRDVHGLKWYRAQERLRERRRKRKG